MASPSGAGHAHVPGALKTRLGRADRLGGAGGPEGVYVVKVWPVVAGERHEGSSVVSAHRTPEGAARAQLKVAEARADGSPIVAEDNGRLNLGTYGAEYVVVIPLDVED